MANEPTIKDVAKAVFDLSTLVDSGFERMDTRFLRIDNRFAQIDATFLQLDNRFAQIDATFLRIDNRFAQIDATFLRIDNRFERIEGKLQDHDVQLDIIARVVADHTVRLDRIEENMATKKDIVTLTGTLDEIVGLARKKDHELVMIGHGMRRMSDDIEKIKPLVGLT